MGKRLLPNFGSSIALFSVEAIDYTTVGTDVTDNYVMILGAEVGKFAPNEEIIDAIRGSFEMWSGGVNNN